MTDPKRWREEESAAVIALIDALRADEPSAATREALWAKVAPAVPPGSGGGGSAAGGGGGGALGAKAIAAGIAVIGAASLLAWIATRSPATSAPPPPPPSASAVKALPATPLPPPEESAAEPVVDAPVPPPPSAARPHAPAPAKQAPQPSSTPTSSASSMDRLREEADGVRRARQLLREKNPGAALAELDRLAKLVPAGPLAEEREVLTIEAMSASGDREGARRRAERFLFERPNSVHASRVRAFAEH